MKHYDYIFTGSGLSALMTVYRMAVSGEFASASILLIDENSKKENDRTWCFWGKPSGEWNHLVHKKWNNGLFLNTKSVFKFPFSPFEYKMIRGADFYSFVFDAISNHPNITFLNQKVNSFTEENEKVIVRTNHESFTCNRLLNSIYNPAWVASQQHFPLLLQHFVGWTIKSGQPVFNSNSATIMDFSIPQKGNTRFMYVLPFSETEALVEYTLFSGDLLEESEYEAAIEQYLNGLGITEYQILEKEKGKIPMTAFPFWKRSNKNIIHIGTAGGWTKASTGYTFINASKNSARLAAFLQQPKSLSEFHVKSRFRFYDMLLVDILCDNNAIGNTIFSALFERVKPELLIKFLQEETTISEDIAVIGKCPKRLFLKALLKRAFRI